MTNLKYAVVRCLQWDSELQVAVLYDNFHSAVEAETARSKYLKDYPKASPQNTQVLQYAT